jgi:hypothetical protein
MASGQVLRAVVNVLRAFDEAVGAGAGAVIGMAAAVRGVLSSFESGHACQRDGSGTEGD